MGDTSKYKEEKQIALGILAHVDAGKTTLSESMLHKGGIVDNIGRVDKKNAFLDNYELEKERGITIFSKQAVFRIGNMRVTLLDTPGHIDFSAEMERTLQVLDYAVLVINGADGVQGHTRTLWRLLERYQIPVFLFINKMDQFKGNDEEKQEEQERLLASLQKELSTSCLDFGGEWNAAFLENLALCEEEVLEHYLESGEVEEADIVKMVAQRKVFPCYFGSALKEEGVDKFLKGVETYTAERKYGDKFAARVFKIARDAQGNRLTYLKVTGGVLKVKMLLKGENRNAEETEIWEEKVDQIRIYSGARYEMVKEAKAGMVCAVTGLDHTFAGEGLGLEEESTIPLLEPVLSYKIELPPECDAHQMLRKLRQLEEMRHHVHAFILRHPSLPRSIAKVVGWFGFVCVRPIADFFYRYRWHALAILLLIATYRISDVVMGVMSNPFYRDMGFTKEEVAAVSKIFGVVMTLVGTFIGGIVVLRIGILKTLFVGALLSAGTNLLFSALAAIGHSLPFLVFTVSADNLSGGLASAAFIAYLSGLTNVQYSATQYAVFSSIMLILPKFLAGFSGVLVESVGYSNFFILTAALGIPVLVLIPIIGYLSRQQGSDKN